MTTPPKSPALQGFEKLLGAGKDGALLRFSLGNEYLKAGDPDTAAAIAKLQPLAASWNQGRNQNVFLAKTDHQLTNSNRLTLR